MSTTTSKKHKGDYEIDNQIAQSLKVLFSDSKLLQDMNEFDFFIYQVNALLKFLSLVVAKNAKRPDWIEIYKKSIRYCLTSKRYEVLIFHFKAFKNYWRTTQLSLSDLVNCIKTMFGSYKNYTSRRVWPNFELNQVLIDYNIKFFDARKTLLLENTINLLCEYYSTQGPSISEDIFSHYLKYWKGVENINILLFGAGSYLKFINGQTNENFRPQMSVWKITNTIMDYYKEREFSNNSVRSQIITIIVNIISLLKKGKYIQNLKQMSIQQKIPSYTFMEKLFGLIIKIDPNDDTILLKLLIQTIIESREQQKVMLLCNPTVYLDKSCTSIEAFRYFVSLSHQLNTIKSKSIKITSCLPLLQRAQQNIHLIVKQIPTINFTYFINSIYVQLHNIEDKLLFQDIFSNLMELIQIFEPEKAGKLIKFLPFYDLALVIEDIIASNQRKLFHIRHLEIKFSLHLIAYFKQQSKKTKLTFMSFLNQYFLPYFQKERLSYRSYCNILKVFSRLSFIEDYQDISNRCVTAIIKVIHIEDYTTNFQAHGYGYIFASMVSFRPDREKSLLLNQHKYKCAADMIKLLTTDLIKGFKRFQQQNTLNIWSNYFKKAMYALYYFFDCIEEEVIEDIQERILTIVHDQRHLQTIMIVIKSIATQLIKCEELSKNIWQEQLVNILALYERIYQQLKKPLQVKESINFIDFCFNMKVDVHNLKHKENCKCILKFQQSILDRIDEMEMLIMDTKAYNYLENLSINAISGGISKFKEVLSISIKSIFYIVYEQKFFSKMQLKKFQEAQKNEKNNFQQEIQGSMAKLKEVREKCKLMLPFFKNFYLANPMKLYVGLVEIKDISLQYSKETLSQLNDLMYMAHLCGHEQLKQILVSIRLSLIYQNESFDIFLLELSKYLFLDIIDEEKQQIIDFVKNCLSKLQVRSEYKQVIQLLLFGKIDQESKIYRIYKIIYLFKTNGVLFFKNYKEIAIYIYSYIFSSPYFPPLIEQQKNLVRQAKNTQPLLVNEKEYWIKNCWQQGWMLTKFITMINQKILQEALHFNQISKIRTLRKFSLIFCARTAHICQLQTPLLLSMKKQEPLNLSRIVDSIRNLQKENKNDINGINQASYRQIDKMIFSKRISISMPHQQSAGRANQITRLYNKISQSFNRCPKTGALLAEIFCQLAAQQLNLNEYQAFIHKNSLRLLSSKLSEEDQHFIDQLQLVDRSLEQDLAYIQKMTERLLSTIVNNYTKALIEKDFISEFIDLALDEDNIASLTPKHHRMIDQSIAKIGLAFEGFNYTIKKMFLQFPRISLRQLSSSELIALSNSSLQTYKRQCSKYPNQIKQELSKLKRSRYPVSLIYPLGKNLFTISFIQSLLVTFSNRYFFQDKIHQCEQLIQANDKLISDKENNNAFYYNKRLGLDRQLGKMCVKINIGIFDINLQFIPSVVYLQYEKTDLNILKFACNDPKIAESHFKIYAKRYQINGISYLHTARNKIQNKVRQNQNLLLLIHEKYLQFPFQLIRSVRQQRGIYRLPSIQYLFQNESKRIQYSIKNCGYLVNTKMDLEKTQQRFQKIRSKFILWNGIKGKIPELGQIQMLFNQSLFLYMGHGSGFEHLKEDEIYLLQPRSCLMLVFGCSSAKMVFEYTQPFGSAFILLMKGCPAYLGCLWTVTDSEIDLMTQQIFGNSQTQNLSLILEQARKKCYFPHVTGSSTVVYGLPVRLKR